MSVERERDAETQAWLRRAAEDLRAAEHNLVASPPLVADSLFHAQQAIEKCLKAFLTDHDRSFRKTHDLVELGRACVDIDRALEEVLRQAAPMTEYAWRYRYPAGADEPPREEADDALRIARQVWSAIAARLHAPGDDVSRAILGVELPVARLEDVLRGKVWAASDPEQRPSKRQKDLADIARILARFPELRDDVPADILGRLI